ncbi:hypothetical protein [Nonomuraea longispora]|nr:hypothetical protein [Nonomuraea longispora]
MGRHRERAAAGAYELLVDPRVEALGDVGSRRHSVLREPLDVRDFVIK